MRWSLSRMPTCLSPRAGRRPPRAATSAGVRPRSARDARSVPAASPWPSAGRRALRPVVEHLGEPAAERARVAAGPGSRRRAPGAPPPSAAVSAATDSREARPTGWMGSPTRTRIVRRNPSQLVPLIAIGTIGTPPRSAKNAVPSASGRSSRSPRWMRPSPKMTMTQPSASTFWTRRVVSSRSVFSGRYGMPKPAHTISLLRPPFVMSASLGPNIASFGFAGRNAQQDQRIGPVEVVAAVHRRAVGQPVGALEADAEQQPDDEPDATTAGRRNGTAGGRDRP